MKPFKHFFKRLAVFSVVSLITYAMMIYIGGELFSKRFKPNINYKIGHNYLRLKEVKQTHNVDLLFLGSSHAYRGFDTRLFKASGYKVFNLGSSAQTPIQTLVLLKRYLKELNPKLVIFEVWPGVFISDGVESSLDLITSDINDRNTLNMVLDIKNMKVFNTYIYTEIKRLIDSEPIYNKNNYHEGGYVSRNENSFNQSEKPKDIEIILNEQQLENFETIIELLNADNVNYILVQAPITSQKYASFTNIDAFNKKMENYGDYYNFNSKLELDDYLDFYDSHHLNQNGVNIFNEAFLELLKKQYATLRNK